MESYFSQEDFENFTITFLEKSNICDTTSEKFSLNNAVTALNCK